MTEQRDGRFAVGFAPRAGRLSGTRLTGIAELADAYGQGRMRTTAQQKLVDPGRPSTGWTRRSRSWPPRTSRCGRARSARHDGLHRDRVLQARDRRDQGRAQDLHTSWSAGCRIPGAVEITVNGCPNSCARFQIADIGFKGSVARGADGEDVEVYQVHLGGHLGAEAALGRKFRGLKVEADSAADYVERVLRGYLERREPEESFAAYAARADEGWLS